MYFFCWSLSSLWLVFWIGPLRVSCGCRRHHSTRDGPQLRHEPRQYRLLPGEGRRRRLHHGRCYRVRHTTDPWPNKWSNSQGRELQRVWKISYIKSICASFSPRPRHPFPRVFNDCNLKELKSYLSSGGGKCLFNLPNTRAMYGGQRCGNGYLEDGEECDCGEEEVFVYCVSWMLQCIYISPACLCQDSYLHALLRVSCRNVPVRAVMPTTALWKPELSAPTVSAVITARY